MNLSPHFTLEELSLSDTATRLGIDNAPPADIVVNLKLLASGLELVRSTLGGPLHINSGYRCEALERVLCEKDFVGWCGRHGKDRRAPGSWSEYFARKGHPRGFCADFVCRSFGTPAKIVDKIRKTTIKFDQLIMEGTWVHVSFAPEMRMMAMTATFTNGTPTFTNLA